MANPFTLIIAGVTGAGAGGDLLTLPAPASTTVPYVDLGSLNMTMSADGAGGSMSFDVIEPKTPSGTTPWWRSGGVYDNARVQFFDSRYSATTPIFLGFITGIEANLLENGIGTRATVSVSDADGWLQKTVIRNGVYDVNTTSTRTVTRGSYVDSFTLGSGVADSDTASTDREIIDLLLKKLGQQITDSATLQLLNTAVISGTTRGRYTGTAQRIGKQTFKATTLQSALDQVAEAAGGLAEVQYRYWIDNDGRLNYGPKETASPYANAPAEIVTDPASVQTGSASTVTRILARDLSVNLDHSDIVKGIFVQAVDGYARYDSNKLWSPAASSQPTNDPYYRTYNGTYFRATVTTAARSGTTATITTSPAHGFASGRSVTVKLSSGPTGYTALNGTFTITGVTTNTFTYTTGTSGTITSGTAVGTASAQGSGTSSDGAGQATRNGPLPQEVFSAPKVSYKSERNRDISLLTRATMMTRSKPVRTVSFSIGGGNLSQTSSPDWSYGYSQGYALTAAATYTLVKAWLPGQYVKINAPSLDLANIVLYIPTVTMRFAEGGGSYQVEYEIQADFRRQYLTGLRGLIGGE
jgi:hypothetical protein